jgi:transketolase
MKIKLPDPRTRDGIKTITRFIVARATSFTVMAIIRQNVETDNSLQDASVFVGAYVIGDMVADATKPYVNAQIDEIAEAIAAIKEAQAELQVSA